MADLRKLCVLVAVLFAVGNIYAQSDQDVQVESDSYMQGDFIEVDLKYEDDSFKLEELRFQENEFTGGAFTPTISGSYSIQLRNSSGQILESKEFKQPDEDDSLHFKFEEGFQADNLTIEDRNGKIIGNWFMPDKLCIGEELPYYCSMNGYENRVDEVNISRSKVDWPEKCRKSEYNQTLEPGKISGNLKNRTSTYIPVEIEEDEYAVMKMEIKDDSWFILRTHGPVEVVTRHGFSYTGRYESSPEEDHGEALVIRDKARENGVFCYELDKPSFNSNVVVGENGSVDPDEQSNPPEKVDEWKAILHVGDSNPEWFRDEEGFINASATLYDNRKGNGVAGGILSSLKGIFSKIL